MPLRMKNAPRNLQREADILIASVKCKIALVYFEDIMLYSSSVADHKNHMSDVIQILQRAGLTLSLSI